MTILIRNCILTAAVLVLPGCLAINALLGVAGFLTTGPIQYAGTVYSVGEYAYEYAANDKTPDEVIGEKFAWLLESDQEVGKESHTLALAKDATLVQKPVATPERQLAEASLAKQPQLTLSPTASVETAPRMVARLRPVPHPAAPVTVAQNTSRKSSPPPSRVQAKPTSMAPVMQAKAVVPALLRHEYVERKANPLQDKLDRMEQGLAQAEQLMNRSPVDGIRYSVPTQESGQTGTSLSGSWSIRHTIMQDSPATVVDTEDDTVLITAHLSS